MLSGGSGSILMTISTPSHPLASAQLSVIVFKILPFAEQTYKVLFCEATHGLADILNAFDLIKV